MATGNQPPVCQFIKWVREKRGANSSEFHSGAQIYATGIAYTCTPTAAI